MMVLLKRWRRWSWWTFIQKGWLLHMAFKGYSHVLVSGRCCYQATQTGWLLNNRNLFPTVLKTGSLRSEGQLCWVLVRTVFWIADFLYPHTVERQPALSFIKRVSFIKTLITSQRPPPLNIITVGVRISTDELRGAQIFSALYLLHFILFPLEPKLHEGKDFVSIVFRCVSSAWTMNST